MDPSPGCPRSRFPWTDPTGRPPSPSRRTDLHRSLFQATDNAGNSSSVVTKTVSLDTIPPVESLVLPPTTTGCTQPTCDHRHASDTLRGGHSRVLCRRRILGGSSANFLGRYAHRASLVTDKAGIPRPLRHPPFRWMQPPQSVFITPRKFFGRCCSNFHAERYDQ